MNSKAIGKRLAQLRGNKSQEQVARELNISTSSIVKYENGERIPRDELKIQIANYYNVSVYDLFFYNQMTRFVSQKGVKWKI